MAWLVLLAASLLEIVWAVALKSSDGFTRVWPAVISTLAASSSFILLSLALKTLPVGTAYAVWVGVGAVGVALVGVVLHGEGMSALRLGLLGLIITGVMGLQFIDQ